MFRTIRDIAVAHFRPALDAVFFGHRLPWSLRWRLLALQPIIFLTHSLALAPYIFRRPYAVRYIPISDTRSLRILVFKEPGKGTGLHGLLRPLHVDCHPGGFVGGIPEADAPFCSLVAKETGAVVVSLSYRLAPVHPFPAAIDDVDAALKWLRDHAEEELGADPRLLTVSGASAGGNLVLAASQNIPSPEYAIRASATFYAPLDLRPKPEEKPRPAGLPAKDPLSFMLALYDSYAAPSKAENMDNPRLSPYLAREETLPERMVLVVAGIDITVHEQLTFVERVKKEREEKGKDGGSVEAFYVEDLFHGCLEVPNVVVPVSKKMVMWQRGLDVIRAAQESHGWQWKKSL
ncbi:lipase esterase family [Colletotrichum truncatum]|uniref:Lipase esterase family n=1 Tax=Colletotrichum truncatum TaxID=5467 RepID=A0ACC3Z8K5_COLTU|nr:lipase esterase family [Colletotrichum truncatum]KAF6789243.1 lipase esterase family [Colletotrichum truncatum]